ncbi:MAG: hypothetical protein Q9166_003258 [cf. Caloplaca sp. 2 TL-2023]
MGYLLDTYNSTFAFALLHQRVPNAFDFARLKSLVDAKYREAEDHLLLIREDPGYFAEQLEEECAHTTEALLNRQQIPRPTPLSKNSWDEAISRVLGRAYHETFVWETVSHLLAELISTCTEQKAELQLGHSLPEARSKVSSRLAFFLDKVILQHLKFFFQYLSDVPTFKGYIVNVKRNGRYESHTTRQPKLMEDEDGNNGQRCGLSNVAQGLETLITKSLQQKERLTWRLISSISDIAVIAETQRQMNLSKCNKYHPAGWSDKKNIAWILSYTAPLQIITEVPQERTGLASLVMDLRVFDCPSDKPRTAASTDKMQSAGQALDKFLARFNEHSMQKAGKTLRELEANRIRHPDIQRTPAWSDLRPSNDRKHGSKAHESFDVSPALITLEERTESTIGQSRRSTTREKTKTRGQSAYHSQAAN